MYLCSNNFAPCCAAARFIQGATLHGYLAAQKSSGPVSRPIKQRPSAASVATRDRRAMGGIVGSVGGDPTKDPTQNSG